MIKENVLKLYLLYLGKFEKLTKEERHQYTKYLNFLSTPVLIQKDQIQYIRRKR